MSMHSDIAQGIVAYLSGNVAGSNTIFDDIDKQITPPDHYATTFYCLAALLLYRFNKDNTLRKKTQIVLNGFLSQTSFTGSNSNRGHKEFNDLAIVNIKKHCYGYLEKDLQQMIDEYVTTKISLFVNYSLGVPNNWFAMHVIGSLIRNVSVNNQPDPSNLRYFEGYIKKGQLPDGFLYDFPTIIKAKSVEASFTYHAKIFAMLAMGNEEIKSGNLLTLLLSAGEALIEFTAPDFESLYFGRTNNGLFGYASAAYAFYKTASFLPYTDPRRQKYLNAGAAMVAWIKKWQRPDGHVAIAPNDYEKEKMGWDSYMHTTVYNAYAAAMLLLIGETEEGTPDYSKKPFHYAASAGLLKINENGMFCVLATSGQKSHIPELYGQARYKGMNIYKLMVDGQDIATPPEIHDPVEYQDLSMEMGGAWHDNGPVYYKPVVQAGNGIISVIATGMLTQRQEANVRPSDHQPARPISGKNRIFIAVEKAVPRRLLPYVHWAVYSVKNAMSEYRNRKFPRFEKSIVVFTREKAIVNIVRCRFKAPVTQVSFQAGPPVGKFYREEKLQTEITVFSSATASQSIRERTLKTSKGPAIQQYGRVGFSTGVYSFDLVATTTYSGKSGMAPVAEKIAESCYKLTFAQTNRSYNLNVTGNRVAIA